MLKKIIKFLFAFAVAGCLGLFVDDSLFSVLAVEFQPKSGSCQTSGMTGGKISGSGCDCGGGGGFREV